MKRHFARRRVVASLAMPSLKTSAIRRALQTKSYFGSASFLQRLDQLAEGVGAMADRMLQIRIELAEGPIVSERDKHRVVAEALVATRWPDERAVDAPVERLGLAVVGPGNRQRAGEMCSRSGIGLGRLGLTPDLLHGARPVASAHLVLGPASGENARPALQRIHAQAAVVGECGQAAQVGGLTSLQVGIVGECVADLFGLRKAEFLGAHDGNPERLDQRCNLTQLARVVRWNDQAVAERSHAVAAFSCVAKISEQPIRASRRRRRSPSSSNVSPSAVSWASTIAPSAVSTKLPSLPAVESSS